jgi:hypothetical protein
MLYKLYKPLVLDCGYGWWALGFVSCLLFWAKEIFGRWRLYYTTSVCCVCTVLSFSRTVFGCVGMIQSFRIRVFRWMDYRLVMVLDLFGWRLWNIMYGVYSERSWYKTSCFSVRDFGFVIESISLLYSVSFAGLPWNETYKKVTRDNEAAFWV